MGQDSPLPQRKSGGSARQELADGHLPSVWESAHRNCFADRSANMVVLDQHHLIQQRMPGPSLKSNT